MWIVKTVTHPWKDLLLFQWKPFKNDEKCFLFHVSSSFHSCDIYIFVLTFWLLEERFDKKAMVNFKVYNVADWTANNYNTHITYYFKR